MRDGLPHFNTDWPCDPLKHGLLNSDVTKKNTRQQKTHFDTLLWQSLCILQCLWRRNAHLSSKEGLA